MSMACVYAVRSRVAWLVQVLRRPAEDLPVLVLIPDRPHGVAGAALLPGRPGPLPVLADVVGHVLRTLENAARPVLDLQKARQSFKCERINGYRI